jgi:hypothetical protein
MPDNFPTALPTRQAVAADGRSGRLKVTGKLKVALDLMVWSGTRRAVAAQQAGMADSSLRFALRKPHVLAHYNTELGALRTSLRAKTIHRLDGIADDSKNDMARVSALKTLEGLTDAAEAQQRPGQASSPGMVIVVMGGATPHMIDQRAGMQIENVASVRTSR